MPIEKLDAIFNSNFQQLRFPQARYVWLDLIAHLKSDKIVVLSYHKFSNLETDHDNYIWTHSSCEFISNGGPLTINFPNLKWTVITFYTNISCQPYILLEKI